MPEHRAHELSAARKQIARPDRVPAVRDRDLKNGLKSWRDRGRADTSKRKYQATAIEPSPPATIPDRSSGRYPGLQDLPYRLPSLMTSGMEDTTTLAYRCGGSSGMASPYGDTHRFPV